MNYSTLQQVSNQFVLTNFSPHKTQIMRVESRTTELVLAFGKGKRETVVKAIQAMRLCRINTSKGVKQVQLFQIGISKKHVMSRRLVLVTRLSKKKQKWGIYGEPWTAKYLPTQQQLILDSENSAVISLIYEQEVSQLYIFQH